MKNKEIASGIIGSAFFAVPYLALTAPFIPSLVIGASAFLATELVLSKTKGEIIINNRNLSEVLEKAKKENKHIASMIPFMNNSTIKEELKEIHDSITKIINTVSKKPEKIEHINNFFDYYLPVTVKIVNRIDEIENQNLNSKESKKFLESSEKMITEINKAFKKILSKLYQSDIVDSDAEMKVFNAMLRSDGFDESEIIKEKE